MKVGLLGSGNVGQALAKGFISEGHEVYLATREPNGDKGTELKSAVPGATVCDFATAAKESELIVLCTAWNAAQEVIEQVKDSLAGKVVIDTNNVIKMDGDHMLYGGYETSAAQQVQDWLPKSKVVKAFNITGAGNMYKPHLSATPTMFIAGDDADAKAQVSGILEAFGWEVLDNGGLYAAQDLEAMAVVNIRNGMANGWDHAFKML